MEFHPIASLMPLMEGQAYEDFKKSIQEQGLEDPIMIYEGKILDGRNRYRACVELGIEPTTKGWDGSDPFQYVVRKNLHRRQLTIEQRAIIADEMATLEDGQKKSGAPRGAPSQREAAKLMGVGRRTVQRVRLIRKSGNKKLMDEVKDGKVKINDAVGQVTNGTIKEVKEGVDHYAGKTFNGIKIVSFVENGSTGAKLYSCVCKCGREFIAPASQIRSGYIKSCGCARKGRIGTRKNKTAAYNPITENQINHAESEKGKLETVIYKTTGLFMYFENADIPMVMSRCTQEEIKSIEKQLSMLARQLNEFKRKFSKEEEPNGDGDNEGAAGILQQTEILEGTA